MDESLRGKLLVASPALVDPNFARTVVLITEHNDEGAMGIVLDRPSDAKVGEVVPQLADAAGPDEPIFVGGPVQPTALVVLAEFTDPERRGLDRHRGRRIRLSGARDGRSGRSVTRRARVYAGYSGWGAGQLEAEMELDSWIVEPPLPPSCSRTSPRRSGAPFWAARAASTRWSRGCRTTPR